NRGGKGIILIDASERNGPVVDVKLVKDSDQVMLITDRGQMIRTSVAEIRETGRNAQGVKIMNVEENERIVALERLTDQDGDGTTNSEMPPEGGDGNGGGTPSVTPPPDGGDLN
ncbi:MAG TPA: DNA gyrase C-terminal beta-propeller domain-containing protein, partial [Labilithrix sp.]